MILKYLNGNNINSKYMENIDKILLDNNSNEYVTFEQAAMLAHILNYRVKTDCAYDVETKQLYKFPEKYNFNQNKSWQGVYGWKYRLYAAPKKDDVIIYLMDKIDFLSRYNKN